MCRPLINWVYKKTNNSLTHHGDMSNTSFENLADSPKRLTSQAKSSAGILEQSMGAGNRVGTGLSYRPARLRRLEESIPRLLKSLKYCLWVRSQHPPTQWNLSPGPALEAMLNKLFTVLKNMFIRSTYICVSVLPLLSNLHLLVHRKMDWWRAPQTAH
jgi:hypothetical protein